MKVIKTLARLYVNDLESVLPFYEGLLNEKTGLRFKFSAINLELASVGDILLIAGSDDALEPFRNTRATLLVDSVEEFKLHLEQNGAKIMRGPMEVPTGKNMTVEHPDGSLIEYIEHNRME